MTAAACRSISDILRQGYVKIKSKTLGLWKTHWVILRRPSSKGPLRLDRYSSEKASNTLDVPEKSDKLDNMLRIDILPQDTRKHALAITLKGLTEASLLFSTDSDFDTKGWVETLHDAYSLFAQDCRPKDIFNAYLLPTPNLSYYGEFIFRVSSTAISLIDIDSDKKPLVTWPLNALRRYGRDATKFTLESGRSCPTGEGLFLFNSYQCEHIYQAVNDASLSLAANNRVTGGSSTLLRTTSVNDSASRQARLHQTASFSSLQGSSLHRELSQNDRRPLPPVPSGQRRK